MGVYDDWYLNEIVLPYILSQYNKICFSWKQKDKLLGTFSSHKSYKNLRVSETDEVNRANAN